MFNQGLSLDQAPPISVPIKFFLSAPIFGVLLGLLFLFSPFLEISNQYSYIAIAAVHLFTLGILSMIIFGAMQQMMPVLAGCVIKKPLLFGNVVHTSLVLGTLGLSSSFIFDIKMFLHIGVLFLSIAFLLFFIITIKLLFKVEFLTSTVKAMRLFSISGLITFFLGLFLAISHISGSMGENYSVFVNSHILFALFGFASLIIMGVSFQVIPMFYVSQDFPKVIQNKVPLVLFALLFISFFFLLFEINFFILKLLFVCIFISYSYFGLKSLNNRKRPVFDITLWYWKLSLIMFILSMILWLFDVFESNFILAIVFAFGFLYSLLQGMVYKIIPFLSWFHLSSKGYFSIPTIREFIEEKNIKYHFFFHLASVVFFVLSYFINTFIYLASILFIISNSMFFINCLIGVKKYSKIAKTDPADMTAFK
ncbi:hypothetical protein KO488_11440 [Poseidonibacter lekithochrous]|uniref:hypothetical protein n=1 Tax=Poseidonibacter TaxID=2321187 RepID=UPI001C091C7E|nr:MULTISPECIES: hypothetical protein [Poseidonibacter]MBU3015374.1 hypothetical protein [Poseidonibacter lekithochrous]MDO6828673.1 hypothetical protein [Poseidonibacter sp. 1_MG-2023]